VASGLATVQAAIEAKIETDWGSNTSICWPNTKFEPAADASFLRVSFAWDDADIVTKIGGSAGTGLNHVTGLLVLDLFVPADGSGFGAADDLVDAARDIVNRLSSVTNVKFAAPSGPVEVARGASALGLSGTTEWAQLQITCPFRVNDFV
jgi:hypothetical protein